jgi:signal transduction histidine kinase
MAENPYRYARLIAWLTWLVVGGQELAPKVFGSTPAAIPWIWFSGFIVFGPMLYILNVGAGSASQSRAYPLLRLGVLTFAAFAMVFADPRSFACALLVIVAWELAISLPMNIALPWIIGQTLLVTFLLLRALPISFVLPEISLYLGYQGYAVITAYVARSEAAAKRRLIVANTELVATQAMLTQSARTLERLRLSRELHDLMGHHLTALIMNLEVERHVGAPATPHVISAQALARELLNDVRNIVKLMRDGDHTDLRRLLEQVAQEIPLIKIHLNIDRDLNEFPSDQAQVVIRVVQELLTNAIRHAQCANIWIDVDRNAESLRLCVRDDGVGAKALSWGHGLVGMRERIEDRGGSLQVNPDAHPGFAVTAILPDAARSG